MDKCWLCGRFVGKKGETYKEALERLGLTKSLYWNTASFGVFICPNGRHDADFQSLEKRLQDAPKIPISRRKRIRSQPKGK